LAELTASEGPGEQRKTSPNATSPPQALLTNYIIAWCDEHGIRMKPKEGTK